jgi:hypothetical protein
VDESCIANALHEVGRAGRIVLANGDYPACNETVPAGVTLTFDPGSLIEIEKGCTFSVLGGISAGNQWIFLNWGNTIKAGVVSFAGNLGTPALNVYWFGAVGDGITNDTLPIQAAMAAGQGSGLPVVFPPGTYMTSNITLGSYPPPSVNPPHDVNAPAVVSIRGTSGGRALFQSTVRALPGTTGFLLSRNDVARADIRDLAIDGAGTAACLDLSWLPGSAPSAQDMITDLSLLNCRGTGLDVDNNNDSVISDDTITMSAGGRDPCAISLDAESGWASLVDDVAFGGAVCVSVQNISMTNDMFFGGIELEGQGMNMVSIVGTQIGMDAATGIALNSTSRGFLGTTSVTCIACWFAGATDGQFMVAGRFGTGARFVSTFFGHGSVFGPITTNQEGYPPIFDLYDCNSWGDLSPNGQVVVVQHGDEGQGGTTLPAAEISGEASMLTSQSDADWVPMSAATARSVCWFSPANQTAAAMAGVYVVAGSGGARLFHPPQAGAAFNVACTPN